MNKSAIVSESEEEGGLAMTEQEFIQQASIQIYGFFELVDELRVQHTGDERWRKHSMEQTASLTADAAELLAHELIERDFLNPKREEAKNND